MIFEDFLARFTTRQKLALLIVIGFLFRLFVVMNAATIGNDSSGYLDVAKRFSSFWDFEWMDAVFTPLYPAFVALMQKLIPDYVTAGRVVSLIFGTLAIPAGYFLGKTIAGEKVGLLTASFIVIHSYMIKYSATILTEAPYYVFFTMATAFWIKALFESDNRAVIWASLFTTLSYLDRPEGLGLLGVTSLWVVFHKFHNIRSDWKRRVWILLCGWGLFIAVALPYLIFLYYSTGGVSVSAKMSSFNSLLMAPLRIGGNIPGFLNEFPRAFGVPVFLLFIYGLIVSWKAKLSPRQWYVLFILGAFWLLYLSILPNIRYFVETMPLALVFVSLGMISIIEKLRQWRGLKAQITMVLIVAVLLGFQLPRGLRVLHESRLPERLTGEYVLDNYGEGIGIISRKSMVTFYARGVFSQIEKGTTLAEIAVFAGRKGIKYMAGYDMRLRQDIKGFESDKELFLDEIKAFERAGVNRKYRLYVFKDIKATGGYGLSSP